jgi:aminoglycoside 3-N-acetyltransferase
MKTYSQAEFTAGLRGIGLQQGDIAFISTRLFTLGRMEEAKTREGFMERVLESFWEVIGGDGTLVFQTYTTQTARFGEPYIHEESMCINGMLSQYVLDHTKRVRSVHPINSYAALGRLDNEICERASTSNYGLESPSDRVLKRDGKIVIVGMDYGSSVFAHYLEAHCLVPYCYNKLLDIPVYIVGEKSDIVFTAHVRYLEYNIDYSFVTMKRAMDEAGIVHTIEIGDGQMHRIDARDYCEVGSGLLRENPFAFLASAPNFTKGKIPYDGTTTGRDGVKKGDGGYNVRDADSLR